MESQATHALKITLTHASGLAVGDFVGKSDPFVKFRLDGGQSARSSVRGSTLEPVWDPPEHFDFKLRDPELQILIVEVFDHDLITRDDLLGSVQIPLKEFLGAKGPGDARTDATSVHDREAKVLPLPLPPPAPLSPSLKAPISESYTLEVPANLQSSTKSPSTVFLRIAVVPLDPYEIRLEVWENECWMLGSGWSSDEKLLVSHRRRWSSEDGETSSDCFEGFAAKVPLGFEGSGWNFCVGRGDRDGWLYATTFAGPWYPDCTSTTLVRRRRWENVCRRARSSRSLRMLRF